MKTFDVRLAQPSDAVAILDLYRRVAATPGGLARQPEEVTPKFVDYIFQSTADGGVHLVAFDSDGALCGELHVTRMKIALFSHVLTDLTVAVDPNWQGQGVGSRLFGALFEAARAQTPPIGRIELWTGGRNLGAQRLYERLGFQIEGRMIGRGRLPDGQVDDDVVMGLLLN